MKVRASNFRSYLDCQRKFRWREDWQYNGPTRPGVMELGSLTHHLVYSEISQRVTLGPSLPLHVNVIAPNSPEALENLNGSIDPEAIRNTAMEWIEQKYPSDPGAQSQAITEHIPYAIAMTRNLLAWLDSNKFFETWEIVMMEQPIEMNVGGNVLSGTPDLVVQHRLVGNHGIVDYKTAGNLSRGLHAADWQLLAYALLCESIGLEPYYGVHLRAKRIKFNKRAKPPYVNDEQIRFNKVKLERGLENIEGLIDRIQKDKLWLPNPTGMCMGSSPCQFLDACEAADSAQDFEYVLGTTHVRINDNSKKGSTTGDPGEA